MSNHRRTAEAVATKLAITGVKPEILPEDKGKIGRKLRGQAERSLCPAMTSTMCPHWLRPM
jgi:cation transport ATPase